MTGAESLLRTAAAAGIEVCFANPGTTEMPIVAAFDAVPGFRAILGLFEGVCTGAADGYARMKGQPALTLLHLGPGLANGIANLHNARRARSPIVNIVGDHATWHLAADAPLTSDIVSLARAVSAWVKTSQSSKELPADMAAAIAAATSGQIATLIVPHDCQLGEAGEPKAGETPALPGPEEGAIRRAAECLKKNQPAMLMIGGPALLECGLHAAGRVAAATGCQLFRETFVARQERGPGLPAPIRFPYFPEEGMKVLSKFQSLVLAGAKESVAFFGYPGLPSRLAPVEMKVETLARPEEDVVGALEALADLLGPGTAGVPPASGQNARVPGALTLQTMPAVVASLQPEGAIIMDEGNVSSGLYYQISAGAARHSYMNLTGGAIGQGLPCATGAAVACPGRPVIAIQADGSAMYTLQALWTQAREKLKVITLLCNNRSYQVLGIEMFRAGAKQMGAQARGMIELKPPLDWVRLAEAQGVPATRVETAEQLAARLQRALAESGPHLIEMIMG